MKHQLLTLLVLVLLSVSVFTFSAVRAVDVKKTVEGPTVLDFGERLKVTIAIDTGTQVLKLNQLTDPVPEGFTASMETSSSCSQSESNVACSFGAGAVNGTYTITYNLVATTPVEKVLIRKATLSYTDPQSPTFQLTKQSNPISEVYTVGPPMINLTRAVSVDGTQVQKLEVLPNSAIKLDFKLQNTGAIDAEEVKLKITPPADWSLSSKASETGFTVGAGESRLVSVELSGPQIDKFQSGATSEISATVSWSGGNRTYSPVETRISLKQVRPEVTVDRSAKVDWKLNGKTLEPLFSASLDIRNAGTSKAIVSVGQDAPQGLGDVTLDPKGSWSNIELAAGASTRLTISGAVADKSTQKLALPAATVTYTDSKGNQYPYTAPEYLKFPLELTVSRGLFEIIFDATSGIYPWGQLVAVLLMAISAWGLKTYGKENKHLTLAFGAIGVLALLVIVSAIKVILL